MPTADPLARQTPPVVAFQQGPGLGVFSVKPGGSLKPLRGLSGPPLSPSPRPPLSASRILVHSFREGPPLAWSRRRISFLTAASPQVPVQPLVVQNGHLVVGGVLDEVGAGINFFHTSHVCGDAGRPPPGSGTLRVCLR